MTTSHNTGNRRTDEFFRAFRDGLPNLSRYDLLLAVVPLAFAAMLTVHLIFDVPLRASLTGGAVIGAVVLADALYLNPPTSRSGETA